MARSRKAPHFKNRNVGHPHKSREILRSAQNDNRKAKASGRARGKSPGAPPTFVFTCAFALGRAPWATNFAPLRMATRDYPLRRFGRFIQVIDTYLGNTGAEGRGFQHSNR